MVPRRLLALLLAALAGQAGWGLVVRRARNQPRRPGALWMARGRLTSFPGSGAADGEGSRKFESVRKNLGIPKEALEGMSLDALEKRMAKRTKKHVTEATRRQLQRQAATAEAQASAVQLSTVELEEIEYYDDDDEGFDGGKTKDAYLSEKEAEALLQKQEGETAVRPKGGATGEAGEAGGFFLRKPAPEPKKEEAPSAKKKRKAKEAAKAKAQAKAEEKALKLQQLREEDVEQIDDSDPRILSLDKLGQIDIAGRADASEGAETETETETEEEETAAAPAGRAATFEDLGIKSPVLLENLKKKLGISTATRAQTQALPLILKGEDTLIQTHTGSGKTLAFLLPLLERVLQRQAMTEEAGGSAKAAGPEILVMSPTRELASQIALVASELVQGSGVSVSCLPGGANQKRQREKLRKEKPAIVVGTPGRLVELTSKGAPGMGSGVLQLKRLNAIVFDEADSLLDSQNTGFRDVKRLVQTIRGASASLNLDIGIEKKLNMVLASATADKEATLKMLQKVDSSAASTDLKVVRLEEESYDSGTAGINKGIVGNGALPPNIAHSYTLAAGQNQIHDTVRRLLNTNPAPECVLIYAQTPEEVTRLTEYLQRNNILAAPLSGKEKKDNRVDVLNSLRRGQLGVVVTTDVTARGLDLPYVTHVVNVGVPKSSKTYVHRAGRCARGGQPGIVFTVVTQDAAEVEEEGALSRRYGLGLLQKYGEQVGFELLEVSLRFARILIEREL
mmetsp:Transcript_44488/g.139536  ORF Transcript_44488/g.139536 Transcript_44488/m.139536 type:complete len:737 (-) Transcript_44488:45-2255(-)